LLTQKFNQNTYGYPFNWVPKLPRGRRLAAGCTTGPQPHERLTLSLLRKGWRKTFSLIFPKGKHIPPIYGIRLCFLFE
jgi:hypothetical protein